MFWIRLIDLLSDGKKYKAHGVKYRHKIGDMDATGAILTFVLVLGKIYYGEAVAVSLTQETPCFLGGTCRLKCFVTSGTNVDGLILSNGRFDLVVCPTATRPLGCQSNLPQFYRLTVEDSSTSYLDILYFNSTLGEGNWSCSHGAHGSISSVQVVQNALPTGSLTFNSTCQSGRVTSPASLSCSGLRPGVPSATLVLMDPSNQTVGSSQTGSVTGTVTRGGQYTCSVSWSAFPSYTLNISSVQCTVQVVPRIEVTSGGPMQVRDGENVTLSCVSSGYPRPSFNWSRGGLEGTTKVNDTMTQGSLTFTADKAGRDRQTVTCTAANVVGQDTTSFILNVTYPPDTAPSITNRPPPVVYMGDNVTLTCQVTGGNPPVSSVTLTCPYQNRTSQGDVTRLQFTADRRDQGSCVCSASHVLGYTQTASVNITTYYPPALPTLTPSPTFPWFEGNSTSLTCMTSDPGLPAARVQWLGDHGGEAVSEGVLQYRSVRAEHQGRRVRCEASNNFTVSRNEPRISSTSLSVEYLPRLSLSPPVDSRVLTVTENKDKVNLTCSAEGNPPPSTPLWSPGGGSRLTFDPVTRDHHGVYTCRASSTSVKFGQLTSLPLSINITVLFAPNVTVTSTPGEDKVITCVAQGRPATYNFRPWVQEFEGQEVQRIPSTPSGGHPSLTLTSYQDSGTYTCSVSNTVLDRQGQLIVSSASTTVYVEDVPHLPLPSDPPAQFAERGERVSLFRTVYSQPALTNYSWFFNSSQTPLSPSDHNMTSSPATVLVPVHGRNVTSQGRNISLEVRAGPLTVGRYTLQACNALGCSTASLALQEARFPSPPNDLRSVSVTSESVTLSWLTGSAGGDFDRWFLVEFRALLGSGGRWRDGGRVEAPREAGLRIGTVLGGLSPQTAYVIRVRAQNSWSGPNLSPYSLDITVETAAARQPEAASLSGGSMTAIGVVISVFVTLGGTLLVGYLVLRYRRQPGRSAGKETNVYENAAFDGQPGVTSPQNETQSSGAQNQVGSNVESENAYSLLDADSREQPRDPNPYQALTVYQNQRSIRK